MDADGPEDWGWAQVWFSYGRFQYEIVCPEQVVQGDEDTISRNLVNAPNNPTGDINCTDYDVAEGEAGILDEDQFGITLRFDTLGDVVVTLHMINMHTGRNGESDSDCDTFTVGGDDVFIGELTDTCTIQVITEEEADVDTDGVEEGDGADGDDEADDGDDDGDTDGEDTPSEPSDFPCGDYVDYYNDLPCITTPRAVAGTCDPSGMSAEMCEGIDEFYDCLIENTNCVDDTLVEDIDDCGLLLNCG